MKLINVLYCIWSYININYDYGRVAMTWSSLIYYTVSDHVLTLTMTMVE
jgi:hypothetical protein